MEITFTWGCGLKTSERAGAWSSLQVIVSGLEIASRGCLRTMCGMVLASIPMRMETTTWERMRMASDKG